MENNNNREDRPRNIHPEEVGHEEPAKRMQAQDKIDINQSESGREMSQSPAEENLDTNATRIDAETLQMKDGNPARSVPDSSDLLEEKDFDRGYRSEINMADNRDQNDSTTDWDAENNESGRHK